MRLSILRHKCCLQGAARPLTGRERIRFAGFERVVITATVEDESEVAHHHTSPKRAVQTRCECNHVPHAVHDRDVAGVAIVIREITGRNLHWSIEWRGVAGEPLGSTGTKRKRSGRLIDQCTTLSGVLFRQQSGVRDLDEVHVAEVLLAISHREFRRFNRGVNVVGAVVTHRFQVIAFENSEREKFCGPLTRRSVLVDLIAAIID